MSEPQQQLGFQVKSGVRGGSVCQQSVSPGVANAPMWQAPDGSGDLLFPDVSSSHCDDPQFDRSAYGSVLDSGGNVAGVFKYQWSSSNNLAMWMIARTGASSYTTGDTPLASANDDRNWAVAMNHGSNFYG